MRLRFSDRTIWIDCTGILRWGPQPMTGIQRVEFSLCSYALDHPDTCGLCAFDHVAKAYRPITKGARDYLVSIIRNQKTDFKRLSKREKLAHLPVQLFYADNETARRLAVAVRGTETRKGFLYGLTKTAIRLVIWGYAGLRAAYQVLRRPFAGRVGKSASAENGHPPVILLSHEVNRSPSIGRLVAEAGLREVDIVHDLIPVLMPELVSARYSQNLDRFFARILKARLPIITNSNAVRDDLIDWARTKFGLTSFDNISACPLTGVFPLSNVDAPIPQLEGRRFAVFCSTFDVRKGQWLLVAAWKRLANMLPSDQLPDLLLIGRTGGGWEDARKELDTASAEVRSKIHIFHNMPDAGLNWAYRNADFALFPSRAEGWGLGVSEALHNGLPVIHSDIPILHEAAQHLMPSARPWDVDAWTSALHELLETPGRLDELRTRIKTDYLVADPEDFPKCVVARLQIEQQRS